MIVFVRNLNIFISYLYEGCPSLRKRAVQHLERKLLFTFVPKVCHLALDTHSQSDPADQNQCGAGSTALFIMVGLHYLSSVGTVLVVKMVEIHVQLLMLGYKLNKRVKRPIPRILQFQIVL